MKNLLYKEFRLAFNPVCYFILFLFPFMTFIPSYPLCISFIYVCVCYPVIFLGANKGVQTNDLLFSMLLPVRRRDIVLSRISLCSIMHFFSIALNAICSFFAKQVLKNVNKEALAQMNLSLNGTSLKLTGVGFGFDEVVFVYCFILLAFSIFDFIFFTLYYRNGHSILLGTLLGMFSFILFIVLTTIILPLSYKNYFAFFANMSTIFRILSFALSVFLYLVCHYFIYKISAKLLEKLDF